MRIFVAIVMVILTGEAGYASNLDRSLSQFHHTAWTAKDGAPSQISALAQTTDGYLWIGTARGLFRFDGVTFERYVPPPGLSLPGHNIYAMVATRDGGLWVSFRPTGVAFVKGDALTTFSRPEELPSAQVYTFATDQEGRVWAGTHNGLELRIGTRWTFIGADWNFPRERVWSLFVDREGTLWVGAGHTALFLRRGSRRFEPTSVQDRRRAVRAGAGRQDLDRRGRGTAPADRWGASPLERRFGCHGLSLRPRRRSLVDLWNGRAHARAISRIGVGRHRAFRGPDRKERFPPAGS